jgi:hypothetical protein
VYLPLLKKDTDRLFEERAEQKAKTISQKTNSDRTEYSAKKKQTVLSDKVSFYLLY